MISRRVAGLLNPIGVPTVELGQKSERFLHGRVHERRHLDRQQGVQWLTSAQRIPGDALVDFVGFAVLFEIEQRICNAKASKSKYITDK